MLILFSILFFGCGFLSMQIAVEQQRMLSLIYWAFIGILSIFAMSACIVLQFVVK